MFSLVYRNIHTTQKNERRRIHKWAHYECPSTQADGPLTHRDIHTGTNTEIQKYKGHWAPYLGGVYTQCVVSSDIHTYIHTYIPYIPYIHESDVLSSIFSLIVS